MTTDLPDPPWRVLANNNNWKAIVGLQFWSWNSKTGMFVLPFIKHEGIVPHSFPESLVIIPHPRNDPEAVEIIRQAKEQKQ